MERLHRFRCALLPQGIFLICLLDLGEAGAAKHMRKMYALRYTAVVIAFGATVYFDVGSPITLLIGVMGLKIGAYLQPYTHKVLLKLKKSK